MYFIFFSTLHVEKELMNKADNSPSVCPEQVEIKTVSKQNTRKPFNQAS